MRFPIDTSTLRFTVAAAPEPATRVAGVRAAGARSASGAENRLRWRVPLRARGGDGADGMVSVTVAGDPQLEPGASVAVQDLTMQTWKRDGRLRMSLRAGAIITEEEAATRAGA